jgi:hypothetical protein
VFEPEEILMAPADVSLLPSRCEEPARRFSEDLGHDALPALEDASSFRQIQPVHLVAAVSEQRRWTPALLTLMEVAVEQELLRRLLDQPAKVAVRAEWPFAEPVGDDTEGKAATDEGREIVDHDASRALVGRRCVVDADEKGPHEP